jgi:hypothetical protein
MKSLMEELRAELLRARAETVELRQALQETQGAHASAHAATGEPAPETVQRLEEEQQLLNAKVEEQYQTKVESASKYRVRLNGIVLMNLFGNRGAVDNLDFPTLALEEDAIERRGGFGGSLRQSLLGFEVFGPQVKGARISADAEFDFAGGFPDALDGVTFGLPRLRTGVMRMIWPKTTVAAGQDVPFFSPLSPSSFASLAVPGLAYSGNLWTWTPRGTPPGPDEQFGRPSSRRNFGSAHRRAPNFSVLSDAAGRRSIAAAGLCHAHCLEPAHVRPAVGSRNGRLLQPPGLEFSSKRRRLGW